MPEKRDLNKKWLWAIESICNGCRNCELMCSFFLNKSFQPNEALIEVVKVEKQGIDMPVTECDGLPCASGGEVALCVKYCPTGALVYGTKEEFVARRNELGEARKKNPEFKIVAPWVERR